MTKIIIINHTFQKERFYKRWKMLSQLHHDLDVTLLAPAQWTWGASRTLTFGNTETEAGKMVDEDNFHIRLIDVNEHLLSSWTSKIMPKLFREIKPDFIYCIGVHTNQSIQQAITYKIRYAHDCKVLVFSMRGKYHALKLKTGKASLPRKIMRHLVYVLNKNRIARMNKYCSAAFCHYPDGREEFIREGFKGPVYMQTQVGVDTDYFHPDKEARKRIREKYNIGNAYCFGSATRFTPDKGLEDIIAALPKEGNWKYLMMGSGLPEEIKAIQKAIEERGLEDKIILPGYIELENMSEYWNALDCAVHVPRTVPTWEETFSLSLVQAMATALPVIGNTSGSVPYQIGPDGIVLEEGNIEQLHKQFVYMLENPTEGMEIGKKMYERATKCFSITHLNDVFYDTIMDIKDGVYDESKIDMTRYLVDR